MNRFRAPLGRVLPSEISHEASYLNRRRLLSAMSAFSALALSGGAGALQQSLRNAIKSPYSTDEALTNFAEATSKTRFRELEDDIAKNSALFSIDPWTVSVEGECLRPRTFDIDALFKLAAIEERIYRMRCTEGFSHVIPYLGYPLSELLRQVQPTGNAKYVEFTSIHRPEQLRGQREVSYISWPYVEGLRIDEAMHPLTIVALGAFGQRLPKALGAPIAIRVPWKYGIKSPKAVVRIRLVEQQPVTVWTKHYPNYHSFWSNVNPDISPNFWKSQASERRAGELFKRATLPFNGYAEQVASMYVGLNPKETF
jgi:methionine sulfoxide reductase catalytic subunit